jgi:hypothetical protein
MLMLRTGAQILFRWLSKFFVLILFSGCVTAAPPVEDYALARAALDAAKIVDAARYSAGYFHKAEQAYKQAVQLYEDREYLEAQAQFRKARDAAERAENSARLIRFKSGEVL